MKVEQKKIQKLVTGAKCTKFLKFMSIIDNLRYSEIYHTLRIGGICQLMAQIVAIYDYNSSDVYMECSLKSMCVLLVSLHTVVSNHKVGKKPGQFALFVFQRFTHFLRHCT